MLKELLANNKLIQIYIINNNQCFIAKSFQLINEENNKHLS